MVTYNRQGLEKYHGAKGDAHITYYYGKVHLQRQVKALGLVWKLPSLVSAKYSNIYIVISPEVVNLLFKMNSLHGIQTLLGASFLNEIWNMNVPVSSHSYIPFLDQMGVSPPISIVFYIALRCSCLVRLAYYHLIRTMWL